MHAAGFAGQNLLPVKNFRPNRFALKIFMAEKISTGKFLDLPDFGPYIFRPGNFRPEFFLVFQLSNWEKIRQKSFRPKK
jgi:hypothetical protein